MMTIPSGALLFPLVAAVLYVVALMALKRANDLGAGVWHSTVVCNVLAALAFQSLLPFGGHWPPLALWWQPLLVAVIFVAGRIWMTVSLDKGDVSVATPLLGLKILLEALFTSLLGQSLSWQLWTVAALSSAGIALLNSSGASRPGEKSLPTITNAMLAATLYALLDVLVQKWSPQWGLGRFLPAAIGLAGLMSFACVPLFSTPLSQLSRGAKRWLCLGAAISALQALLFTGSIAHFGAATASNVVYGSRGLWSVLAVALIGHHFHSTEHKLAPQILRWRFSGAALMFAAIALVLL